MNLIELNRALRQLRLGGIAAVLEMRLHQAQVESMATIDHSDFRYSMSGIPKNVRAD